MTAALTGALILAVLMILVMTVLWPRRRSTSTLMPRLILFFYRWARFWLAFAHGLDHGYAAYLEERERWTIDPVFSRGTV